MMYRINKEDALLGLTDAPVWVRMQENGCYGLCQEAEASGIAWGGSVYHLAGREALEGAEDVQVVPSDAGEELKALAEENALLKAQVSAQSDQMDFYEDCIAEMAETVYA